MGGFHLTCFRIDLHVFLGVHFLKNTGFISPIFSQINNENSLCIREEIGKMKPIFSRKESPKNT
jgi:hypothetical protein